jgi:hypothetical protein
VAPSPLALPFAGSPNRCPAIASNEATLLVFAHDVLCCHLWRTNQLRAGKFSRSEWLAGNRLSLTLLIVSTAPTSGAGSFFMPFISWSTALDAAFTFELKSWAFSRNRSSRRPEELRGEDLRIAEDVLAANQRKFELLAADVRSEYAQVVAIDERLGVLREDLRKYQNAKRLKDRGGFGQLKVVEGVCPTCNQPIKDALLAQDRPANPMSLEDNISFLHDQIGTFQEIREESRSALTAKEEQLQTIRRRVEESSTIVRDHKRMLRSDAEAPSVAAIREELFLEQRLDDLKASQQIFNVLLTKFGQMAKRWTSIQSRLKEIRSSGLSAEDSAKIIKLTDLYLEQLKDYGFSSYPLEEIALSSESYRPIVNGYEMGLTSASDAIRSIWAYLIGMLEVRREFETNHIGFIIFDEPKQQSAADLSFAALLKRAANSKSSGQQVIFSTSEKRERFDEMLKKLDCTRKNFDGKMLTPMSQLS